MLLQAVDTVFVQARRDGLAVAADWALVIVAASLVVAVLMVVLFMARAGRAARQLTRMAGQKADPVLERSRAVAANLEFITGTLRTDMEGLHRSVQALSGRLKQASDHMETRIEEFNALMEVVQGEAEDVFLDTAATARGVRAGARRLVAAPRPDGERGSPTPPRDPETVPGDAGPDEA